jgi:NADPH-dependent ferric siderophore reductase
MNAALRLTAETTIALATPVAVMAKLREHFIEHGEVSGEPDHWSVSFDIGVAEAIARDGAVHFRVFAADTTSLSYLQWGVAEHVQEFAPGEASEIVWSGGARPGAPLPYFREMRVVRAVQVTPRMRRVTLTGSDLGRFTHPGMHVRLLLAPRKGVRPVWPVMAADGRQAWPAGPRPVPRVYTIRRIDVAAGEVDIDFVLHEGDDNPGATFALEAMPGDIVGMTGPGGGDLPSAGRYVLAGDETALPAIGRMVEEMSVDREALVMIEIADDAERQELSSKGAVDLRWLSRNGKPAGATTLLQDAVRGLDLAAGSFVWVGCEHAAAREIRRCLRKENGISRRDCLVAAYWRRGVSGEIVERD